MLTPQPLAGSAVAAIADAAHRPGELLAPPQLLELAAAVAEADADWRPLLRHDPDRRWYARLYVSAEVEVWLLGWSAGQDTGLHDHGGTHGAFHVVEGVLTEDVVEWARDGTPLRRRRHPRGGGASFGPEYVHNVSNRGPRVATSIHAYSPPLATMRFYERDDTGALRIVGTLDEGGPDPRWPLAAAPVQERPAARRSVEAMLAAARRRLRRLDAREAAAAVRDGALLVDIRPTEQRREHGEIPGAVAVERNVLEWRLDPASDARIPEASHDRDIVILCQQGYASSLAAASLQELGLARATDLAGGFEAWVAAGLPVVRR